MPGGNDAGAPLLAMPGARQRRAESLDDAATVTNLISHIAAGERHLCTSSTAVGVALMVT
jgi:hypothetical protein